MDKRNWLEIDLDNFGYNLRVIRGKMQPRCRLMAVVKQNAYGHGLIPLAKYLENKVDFLGVNSLEEAERLLHAEIKTPLLVLSNTIFFKGIDYFLKKGVRFSVMEPGLLEVLNRRAKKNNLKAPVHIKVDTGMGRLGLRVDEAFSFIERAFSLKNVEVEGLYSHFSCAEDNPAYTNYQFENFERLLDKLKKRNFSVKIRHLCNSAAFLNFKRAHLDMVRIGLFLYGIKHSPSLKINLKPVLSFKARLIYIKELPSGSFISYGNTFKTRKKTLVGVISCGYAYGYPWSLSNKAEVLIKGERCKVLGRVCMDHMIIDLSNLKYPPSLGEEVVLIGRQKSQEITVEELSLKANTIPYQIITNLSSSLERIYQQKGR